MPLHTLTIVRTALLILGFCILVPAVAAGLIAYDALREPADITFLNASNDPTRELWRAVNRKFIAEYAAETGLRVEIRQSHGGSASQARAILDGLQADVATLGFWFDTDMLRRGGLVAADWESRLPHRACPYHSTIVFVVRRGNPKNIRDWPDLVRDGMRVITPNPKTSGNGKLAFLAAWGTIRCRGGTDDEAREFVREFYSHVPVMDTGARGATTTFAQNGIGDVHLTWENEARLEVSESGGALEVVYPPISILAEPPVTVIDSVVDRRGTRAVAERYLLRLFDRPYQELLAENHLRPIDPEILAKYADRFPQIELFPITRIAAGWGAAQDRFFSLGGEFDQLYLPKQK
ncbi:MAG: sulfate ABC transporter substrate-binding protein [Gemmataceae bacterium]|nr:sulfate ABC transporter substrate-binding protein [Gemmataceae bacterium]